MYVSHQLSDFKLVDVPHQPKHSKQQKTKDANFQLSGRRIFVPTKNTNTKEAPTIQRHFKKKKKKPNKNSDTFT